MADFSAMVKRIASLYAPENVSCLAITPDGGQLIIGAGTRLLVHNLPEELSSECDLPRAAAIDLPGNVTSIVVSPDGKTAFAAVGDKVHVLAIS